MTENLKLNHEQVMSDIASQIPTFYMRYEDLKLNAEPVLTDLFKFLLDMDSLEGTVCERQIKEVTASGFSDKAFYALKSTSPSLCRYR